MEVPSSVPIESQLGLPPTTATTAATTTTTTVTTTTAAAAPTTTAAYYPLPDPFPTDSIYDSFSDQLVNSYVAPPEQPVEFVDPLEPSPTRGVDLFDSPVPDFESLATESQWSPQTRFQHTPKSIMDWFSKNYATRRDPPLSGKNWSEQNGGIWCKICSPPLFVDSFSYRQHKEEIHGIDFKTGFEYWAPLDVQPISGVIGIGYEGYCGTCLLWIPMDLSKPDFNWFHHASRVCAFPPDPRRNRKEKKRERKN